MERMLRPHRTRSGVTLGWLLGVLAVIIVVVIVVFLVRQPGAPPATDESAPPAAEGEAPADGSDEGGDPEEADGAAAEEAEASPGPIDASVESPGEDTVLQAEAGSREVDAGDQLSDAVGAILAAKEEAESRIQGLETAEVGRTEPGDLLRVEGSGEGAQARVVDAQMGEGPDVAGAREAARAMAASEAEAEQGPRRTSLPSREATGDEAEQARTRTAEIQDASTRLLEDVRASVQSVGRAERSPSERASVDLADGASQAPAADSESRIITLQPIDASGALERARPGVDAAE